MLPTKSKDLLLSSPMRQNRRISVQNSSIRQEVNTARPLLTPLSFGATASVAVALLPFQQGIRQRLDTKHDYFYIVVVIMLEDCA